MSKKANKNRGHYCKVCGERKSNESFSGKGHASHICKSCSKKSSADRAKEMTLRRLEELPAGRLSEQQYKWLKNRMRDSREDVKELANHVYATRYPQAHSRELKRMLQVKTLSLYTNAIVYDACSGEKQAAAIFELNRNIPVIIRRSLSGSDISQEIHMDGKEYKKLLRFIIHDCEIYRWEYDYSDESEEPIYTHNIFMRTVDKEQGIKDNATWTAHVRYCDGMEQVQSGTDDYLPDKVSDLYCELERQFEQYR